VINTPPSSKSSKETALKRSQRSKPLLRAPDHQYSQKCQKLPEPRIPRVPPCTSFLALERLTGCKFVQRDFVSRGVFLQQCNDTTHCWPCSFTTHSTWSRLRRGHGVSDVDMESLTWTTCRSAVARRVQRRQWSTHDRAVTVAWANSAEMQNEKYHLFPKEFPDPPSKPNRIHLQRPCWAVYVMLYVPPFPNERTCCPASHVHQLKHL